jgi:hypothetical protein
MKEEDARMRIEHRREHCYWETLLSVPVQRRKGAPTWEGGAQSFVPELREENLPSSFKPLLPQPFTGHASPVKFLHGYT